MFGMFDYLDLESDLTDEELAMREQTREFVQESVDDIADHYQSGTFPTELIPKMGQLNMFAPTLEDYGLPGISERAYGLMMQELEAGDSGLRSMASVQGGLVMYALHEYGSDQQREQWLPRLARGDAVGAFALTEPEHGSNPAGMTTEAKRQGDQYILSGAKRWCTNSPIADLLIVWARDRSQANEPVRGFLVDPDQEGVTIERIEGKLSLRASSSGEFELNDVRIPTENVLPATEGMGAPLSCLNQARYGIVWGAVGAARDCFETAREYATDREQFGAPIARFQLQQNKLVEMAQSVTMAQLLAHRLADLKSRDKLRHQQVSLGKRHNVQIARNVARTAREMLGGNGITDQYSPMRHMMNMETVSTYEGTHDIHTLIMGEDLTGISAFR
jgi:glutaryl-CoA dehydrogenase